MSMNRKTTRHILAALAGTAVAVTAMTMMGSAAAPKFYNDDPVWVERDTEDASDIWPTLYAEVPALTVERIAVVALIVILFNGGMDIGWRRLRGAQFSRRAQRHSAPVPGPT